MISSSTHRSGVAVLLLVFVLGIVSMLTVSGTTYTLVRRISGERTVVSAEQALAAAEAGAEEVILRVKRAETVPSPLTVTVGSGTATVTNSTIGVLTTVTSTGNVGGVKRAVQVVLEKGSTSVQFLYGVQVDRGGIEMLNNARVNGSVYSGGDITGAGGVVITGDATVAVGTSGSIDQQWTTNNAGYDAGISVNGNTAAVVDSGGDVGEYSSMALGSDGFARISYYDTSNKDLKFSRCLDADCTTKNVTTLDSGGDVGDRYTAIALGADGFARISYLDQSNDNLKFIRCTNADCTAKNTTVVDTDDGQYSSMALGSDGFARIAYYDGDLNFVRCLDADCTTKNITEPDSTGDTGQYTSLALGSDGFARITYIDVSNKDLEFVRCTNADCTTKNLSTIDAGGTIHRNTSLVLGSDGFARVSYMDDGNDDLKYARCLDADCATKNVTTADTNEGSYSAIALGSDGLPRISYYTSSDLGLVRCTNDDCTTKTVTTVEVTDNVGQYTDIALGSDNLLRITHYDSTNRDLRFVRCLAEACTPSFNQVDFAQSFRPASTKRLDSANLYLKKAGSPGNPTIRIVGDSGGAPNTTVLATAFLDASRVGTSYAWISLEFSADPTLNAGTTYWIVFDTTLDNANHYVWGGDSTSGYANGAAQRSDDWSLGEWTTLGSDLNFQVLTGGTDYRITTASVNGSAAAHFLQSLTVGGNATGFSFDNGTIGASLTADQINQCTVGGNASYNIKTTCTIGGGQTTPITPPADPAYIPLPVTGSMLSQWQSDATAGGTIVGDYNPPDGTSSLGPKKIIGDLIMDNNEDIVITGTVWVTGNIDLSNGAKITLDSGYGSTSGIVLADGWIHVQNNGNFQGSGQPNSYIMLLTTLACTGASGVGCGHHNGAIDLHNNATGVIFYAMNGLVHIHQSTNVTEIVGWKLHLENTSVITYEAGLASAQFTSGPGGGYTTTSWKEIVPP